MSLGSFAREHYELMRDHDRADEIFNLSPRKAPQGEFPEFDSVVAEHSDLPENLAKHGQAHLDVAPRSLLRRTGLQPLRISFANLIFEALENLVGLKGASHAGAPRSHDVFVGKPEVYIGFAAFILDQTVLALQTIPE